LREISLVRIAILHELLLLLVKIEGALILLRVYKCLTRSWILMKIVILQLFMKIGVFIKVLLILLSGWWRKLLFRQRVKLLISHHNLRYKFLLSVCYWIHAIGG
jgi:hypothetical protein